MENNLKVLKEQVKKGSVSAALALAEGYKWGYFGMSDPRRAAAMYRICCRSKDKKTSALGYYNLGVLYYHGYLLPEEEAAKSRRLAYTCFLKSAMLDQRPETLRLLGDMYRYGQYVEKDDKIAMDLYLRANQGA